ncbi:hypothetical protein A3860_24565 [Niastella vici]|uniref:Uncharacterized protein n=1 Tax=Niastella vici TaxID=1703345 RepID=A0A1V9FYX7_9BACT|nr:hypothetical protein A3860_24565 [Niastella vici]
MKGQKLAASNRKQGGILTGKRIKRLIATKKITIACLTQCPGICLYFGYKNANSDIGLPGGYLFSTLRLRSGQVRSGQARSENKKALPEESGKAISL